eukprot:582919-Prymnesium_polylepis.2
MAAPWSAGFHSSQSVPYRDQFLVTNWVASQYGELVMPVRTNALRFVNEDPSLGANLHLIRIIMYAERMST